MYARGYAVAQIHLHDAAGGRSPRAFAIATGPQSAGMLPMHERLFERRTSQPEAHTAGVLAKIDALRGGVGRTEQPAKPAPQIGGAQQERPERLYRRGLRAAR